MAGIISLVTELTLSKKLIWTRFSPKVWGCSTRNVAVNFGLREEWNFLDNLLEGNLTTETLEYKNDFIPYFSIFIDGCSEYIPISKAEAGKLFRAMKQADASLLTPRPIRDTFINDLEKLV